MIPDEDAKKPEGWLDNEPEEVDDPGEWNPNEAGGRGGRTMRAEGKR